MVVFAKIGNECADFDVQVDGRRWVVEIGLDGDDGSLVGKYLPVGIRYGFADVGGNLFFVGADQKKHGCVAFQKGMGLLLVPRVVAGEDKPAMMEESGVRGSSELLSSYW